MQWVVRLLMAAGVGVVVSCGGPPVGEPDGGAGGGSAGGGAGGTAAGGSSGGGSSDGGAADAGQPAARGSACTSNASCASGFCVDGVCCESACTGSCTACIASETGAADGLCAPITEATDPDNECPVAPGSCDTGTCNGAGACGRAQNGAVCRPAAGPCDAEERCANDLCPMDALLPSSTTCRPSAGPCDVAETCSGGGPGCPPDVFSSSATVCRASAGACDPEERCSGAGAMCPSDALAPAQTPCRTARGPCDVEEQCSGSSTACPADVRAPNTTVCRAAAGPCDVEERCSGAADTCPVDTLSPSTQVCRPSAGVCDSQERCSGTAPACPADVKLTTVCRPAVSTCDLAESCDGLTNDCPANIGQPPTTEVCAPYRCNATTLMCTSGACNNDSQCAPASFCRGGVCVRGKRIFVTSTTYGGDFGGPASADALCQGRAQAGALSGTYKAWLSTSTVNARDRITQSTVPYYRRSASSILLVANNYAELVANGQPRTISFTELGSAVAGFVWTGSNNSGVYSAPACTDWQTGAGNGRFGTIGATTVPGWTDDGTGPCSFPRRLYCIEQ
ncbi:MAG: DUF1554 domain-containing protein [Myxococcaceae bacterium]|nr:DUF1554 domain-containing protein [Myxococcaceae bacterium]